MMIQNSNQYFNTEDGTKLFMRSWIPKENSEQVIFCLHGMNSHSGFFNRIGVALARKGSAIYAPDIRGNGLSGDPGDAESIDRQITDIDFMIEKLQSQYPNKPFYLLGHSLGAGYALRYVYMYPDKVKGIILISPSVKVRYNKSLRTLLTMMLIGFRIFLTPHARWDTTIEWTKAFRESKLGKIIANDPACIKEFTYRYTRCLMGVSGKVLLRYATSVTLPTLLLQGEKDTVVNPEGAKLLYDRLATIRKQIIMLPEADHDLFELMLPSDGELSKNANHVIEIIHQWITKTKE